MYACVGTGQEKGDGRSAAKRQNRKQRPVAGIIEVIESNQFKRSGTAMLLNFRDLGEIRANEMRRVKPIILNWIDHDFQERFIPGLGATIKDSGRRLSVQGVSRQFSVLSHKRCRWVEGPVLK